MLAPLLLIQHACWASSEQLNAEPRKHKHDCINICYCKGFDLITDRFSHDSRNFTHMVSKVDGHRLN